ncbi:MAG: glycosyltransferase WbuB [Candidatus Zixiibacteriota bacterium]|nr:MAG: glycosyltransferase WbuB [candidate division Zixibacteria bacterium]
MNILIINHYAGSPIYGMEFRPYYLAKEWQKRNHQVTIVAASFSHLRNKAPQLAGTVTEEVIDGIRYLWIKTPAYEGNGVARILNMFAFTSSLYFLRSKFASEIRPDVVIASSTYPLDIYPARAIARKAGARLIFEVHDLWPLSPMEVGGMSRNHPFVIVMQAAENYAYRHADKVVSMLSKAEGHMRDHGMSSGKFVYIPNGIDIVEWERERTPLPLAHAEILTQLKREGRFIVGYAGAHGLANVLGTVVDAALLLSEAPMDFVLVGQGPEKDALMKNTAQLGLRNIHFLPTVPRGAIPALLDGMDALYIGLQKQPLFRFGVSPNKLIDYMMAGVPVIQAIAAGNDLVSESGCGITIPPEDPQALVAAVRKMMDKTPEERKSMGKKGRNYVLVHHAYEVLATRFERAISEC